MKNCQINPANLEQESRYEYLDGLRFLCAVHILSGHLFEPYFIHFKLPDYLIIFFSSSGSATLTIFLWLSGFLLASNRIKKNNKSTSTSESTALIQRIARPYVLGLCSIIFVIAVQLIIKIPMLPSFDPCRLVADMFFAGPLLGLDKYTGLMHNPALWSLTIFFIGYCIDWRFGIRLTKLRYPWIVMFICSIISPLAYSYWYMEMYGQPGFPPRVYSDRASIAHAFPWFHVGHVIAGMLLANILHNNIKHNYRNFIIFFLLLIICECSLIYLCTIDRAWAFLSVHGLIIPLAPSIIAVFAIGSKIIPPPGWLKNLMRSLADHALPIYIWHLPIGLLFFHMFFLASCYTLQPYKYNLLLLVYVILFFITLGIFSYLSVKFVHRFNLMFKAKT